jgi:hypothetical protein
MMITGQPPKFDGTRDNLGAGDRSRRPPSGEPLCPANDIDTAVEKMGHVLASQSDPGVMGIRRQADA